MQFAQYYQYYGPLDGGFQRDHSVFGMLFGLVFLLALGVLAYYAIRAIAQHSAPTHRDPLDIARERFAKGEISKDELAEIKKELK